MRELPQIRRPAWDFAAAGPDGCLTVAVRHALFCGASVMRRYFLRCGHRQSINSSQRPPKCFGGRCCVRSMFRCLTAQTGGTLFRAALLQFQQLLFDLQSAAKAAEPAIGSDDPMTRQNDGDGIAVVALTDGAERARAADRFGQLAV